jgi:hypothetical protein
MVPREEYIGIKWGLIYKEMTFEKSLSCVEIFKMKLFSVNGIGYWWILVIDGKYIL